MEPYPNNDIVNPNEVESSKLSLEKSSEVLRDLHNYQFYFDKIQVVGDLDFSQDHNKIYSSHHTPYKKSISTTAIEGKFGTIALSSKEIGVSPTAMNTKSEVNKKLASLNSFKTTKDIKHVTDSKEEKIIYIKDESDKNNQRSMNRKQLCLKHCCIII